MIYWEQDIFMQAHIQDAIVISSAQMPCTTKYGGYCNSEAFQALNELLQSFPTLSLKPDYGNRDMF